MLKDISRTAVDRYLKVVRTPFDALLGDREGDRSKSLGLRIDRADAAVRAAAGTALRDPELRDDARRRRDAADERERALRLRGVATEHAERADREAEAVEREADERRRKAARESERKKQQAEKRRTSEKKQARKKAAEKKSTARKRATAKKREASENAKPERLAGVRERAAALAEKEAAVNAADESKRLEEAAATAKAERKSEG
jgi:hypothetical protein